jgi:hypothetical protein
VISSNQAGREEDGRNKERFARNVPRTLFGALSQNTPSNNTPHFHFHLSPAGNLSFSVHTLYLSMKVAYRWTCGWKHAEEEGKGGVREKGQSENRGQLISYAPPPALRKSFFSLHIIEHVWSIKSADQNQSQTSKRALLDRGPLDNADAAAPLRSAALRTGDQRQLSSAFIKTTVACSMIAALPLGTVSS